MRVFTTVSNLLTGHRPVDIVRRLCPKVMSQAFNSVCGLGRLVQYITTMVHRKKNKAKKIALCSMIIAVLCEEEMPRREW